MYHWMEPKREQAGYAVTAFMDRIMKIPGMKERLEAAVEQRKREAEQQEHDNETATRL